MLEERKRCERQGCERASRGNEGEHAHMRHCLLLELEGDAPERGSHEKQEIGSEAGHGGEIFVKARRGVYSLLAGSSGE